MDIVWAAICSSGMPIDYDRFYTLPRSKVMRLLEIAKEVRQHRMENEGAGAIARIFGAKPD